MLTNRSPLIRFRNRREQKSVSKLANWDNGHVIGRSPKVANTMFAFGHQHIVLSAAPKTAHIVADLIGSRTPNVDIHPFRSDRF